MTPSKKIIFLVLILALSLTGCAPQVQINSPEDSITDIVQEKINQGETILSIIQFIVIVWMVKIGFELVDAVQQ